ncbi:nucleotide pyrophosphohydrolase [Kineococcus sp. R8]|uniref:nucleotide pyrophosphohydrolase n=1 Tax=Kineococcus siccus TaxID=2696567 RepID=UPI001411BF8F|nr:nucleotide pyrophosphohydrolase [Kineococcus siccus]NAZ80577.1 nucleotide pyrophosphohydrolase [Kineococcus siccus]
MSFRELQSSLNSFARERDWEQFHTPKNLIMALTGEVGELTELFQWLTPQECEAVAVNEVQRVRVAEEMADILAYLLRLADVLSIDLEAALKAKIVVNEQKYPVDRSRGNARKYTDYEEQS